MFIRFEGTSLHWLSCTAFSRTLFSATLLIAYQYANSAIKGPQLLLLSHYPTTDIPCSQQLLSIYAQTRTIAVVGVSADASKVAHQVPLYLQSQVYWSLSVNPCG